MLPSSPLPNTAKKNIEAIAQFEQELDDRRSTVERIGDGIAGFFGSLWFIAAHAIAVIAWVAFNIRVVSVVEAFDPYPFPLLSLMVGIEFILLTTFVLMNQNLQSRRQEKWGHLTLQISLLTEQEVTKNMQILHEICRHLGVNEELSADPESKDLAQTTVLSELVAEIERAREPKVSDSPLAVSQTPT